MELDVAFQFNFGVLLLKMRWEHFPVVGKLE